MLFYTKAAFIHISLFRSVTSSCLFIFVFRFITLSHDRTVDLTLDGFEVLKFLFYTFFETAFATQFIKILTFCTPLCL